MKYQSTRNHALTASPAAAVLQGIAPDGGLYMPEAIPVLDWQSLMKEDTLTMSGLRGYARLGAPGLRRKV